MEPRDDRRQMRAHRFQIHVVADAVPQLDRRRGGRVHRRRRVIVDGEGVNGWIAGAQRARAVAVVPANWSNFVTTAFNVIHAF